jgi:hypothetical protein
MARTKMAPTLSALEKARWNFMDTPQSHELVGGEYAKAESEMWDRASHELRALKAVARSAEDVLCGLDALMNESPPIMFPYRGYLVERSAMLRARLRRASGSERGRR